MKSEMASLRSPAVQVLLAIAVLGPGCGERDRSHTTGQSRDPVQPRLSSTGPDTECIRRYHEIESRRTEIEQTVFRQELEAQRHEAVFISLWDQLRRSSDNLAPLADFPFGEITLGSPTEPLPLEQGITLRRFDRPFHAIPREEWRRLIQQWEEKGYRLEQSEWRHPEFRPGTNSAPVSTIFVRLHIRKSESEERFILRGNLHVEWDAARRPDESPVAGLIDATQLELLSRTETPSFSHVLTKVVARDDEHVMVDPLILYDLNGDGLSEVILVSRNLVYWNRGSGQFQGAKEAMQNNLTTMR